MSPMVHFQLTSLQPMTDLMRWSMTSIYLIHFETNVELRDGVGNAFVGKSTLSAANCRRERIGEFTRIGVWPD